MRIRNALLTLLLPSLLHSQQIVESTTGTTALLQAISAVDSNVVWVSGHRGVVLRSTDGGRNWQRLPVPETDSLQFRDIHATSTDLAWALSAGPGELSRIYHTRDGGRTWVLQFRNTDPDAFYDCFAFFDGRRGVAYGDASRGRTNLLATRNGGGSWQLVDRVTVPAPLEGEGAFAASGGCVTTQGQRHGWVALGSPAARVFRTENGGATWTSFPTPLVSGESAGLTAVHFRDPEHGIAVAGRIGEYATDTAAAAVAVSNDGGRTWTQRSRPPRPGTPFGVTWVPAVGDSVALAAGPGGLFLTRDSGGSWTTLDERSFWSVAASGRVAWAAGPRGTVVRIEF